MKSADLITDLYQLEFSYPENDLKFKRVLSPNSDAVIAFVDAHFSKGWVSESKAALYKTQPTCFVALDGDKIVGFACYDATAKGYFGPMGVDSNYRKRGIGSILVMKCLEAMYHDGYGYAIIGSVSESNFHFYHQICKSVPIENSTKLYSRLINK
jgi:ribosomal protein S18 acetylase RimI-like enzyme